jgi:hypothetical protein
MMALPANANLAQNATHGMKWQQELNHDNG